MQQRSEETRANIISSAIKLFSTRGFNAASVGDICKEAGISKSLVYAYFPNLTELLRELYQREMRHIRRAQADAANGAATFEDLVRSITHAYLSYMHERGPLIERLAAEPSVSEMRDPTEFSRNKAVDYLAEIITHHFDLPPDIARAATDISFGLPASAGSYLHRGNLDLKTVEDLTVTMIIGTIIHLKDEYSVRRQPLRRQD